jgi:hypothetical protein
VLNALERLANGYGSEIVRVRQDLAIAESQLRDYQARLGEPFPQEAYLAELTEVRDRLKAGLSAGSHDEGEDVPAIASRIKALIAAHTTEATTQRVQRKESTAEEPITARIRRRQEANAEAGQAVQPGQPEAANDNHHADNDNQPTNGSVRPPSFRERIKKERQQRSDGNSPD